MLLRPSKLVNQVFMYCLAVAAEKYEVDICSVCVMSNHWHAVIYDRDGRYPEYLAWVHRMTAKCINASLGRWENVWAAEQPSMVRLEEDVDVIDKIVYCLTNPVKAGLVRSHRQWPGVILGPESWGREIRTRRPRLIFGEGGISPEEAVITLKRPPIQSSLSDENLRGKLQEEVAAETKRLVQKMKRKGRSFLGRIGVLQQRPTDRPRSGHRRRGFHPQVAAKNRWRRVEALRRLRSFLEAYRAAFAQWRAGVKGVIFPAGTYALRFQVAVQSSYG
jgi:REP element-mobilizing transposase RayT